MGKRFFLFFILFTLFILSCKEVPCKDTICDNAGIITYNQGNCYCSCPLSTRGLNCEIDLTDSVEGVYSVYDTSLVGNSMSIEQLTRVDSNVFRILGLGNSPVPYDNCPVNIIVKEEALLIDSQFLCNNSNITDSYLIYGSGLINYDLYVLKINYYITHLMGVSNQIDTCRVFIKK